MDKKKLSIKIRYAQWTTHTYYVDIPECPGMYDLVLCEGSGLFHWAWGAEGPGKGSSESFKSKAKALQWLKRNEQALAAHFVAVKAHYGRVKQSGHALEEQSLKLRVRP